MTKFVFFALASLALFTVSSARFVTDNNANNNNDTALIENESRVLIEAPSIGTVIYKGSRIVWFFLSTLCTIFDYKLAAVAIAVNIGYYLFSNCTSILIGAAVIFGFCKLTGLCSHGAAVDVYDHLAYAARSLDLGISKYGDSN